MERASDESGSCLSGCQLRPPRLLRALVRTGLLLVRNVRPDRKDGSFGAHEDEKAIRLLAPGDEAAEPTALGRRSVVERSVGSRRRVRRVFLPVDGLPGTAFHVADLRAGLLGRLLV